MPCGSSAISASTPQTASSRPSAPPMIAEDDALGEQLPNQPRPAGAERGANRDLALARRGPRQQQVRDVDTRNQQHEADGAEQQPERLANIAHHRLVQRHRRDAQSFVAVRVLRRELTADRLDLEAHLFGRHTGLGPPDGLQIPCAALLAEQVFRCTRAAPTRERAAGNENPCGMTPTISCVTPSRCHRLADDRGVAAKASLPQVVTEDRDPVSCPVRSPPAGRCVRASPARPAG